MELESYYTKKKKKKMNILAVVFSIVFFFYFFHTPISNFKMLKRPKSIVPGTGTRDNKEIRFREEIYYPAFNLPTGVFLNCKRTSLRVCKRKTRIMYSVPFHRNIFVRFFSVLSITSDRQSLNNIVENNNGRFGYTDVASGIQYCDSERKKKK